MTGRAICPEVNVGGIQCMSDAGHTGTHWALLDDWQSMWWNTVDWAAEQAELDELERTDPDVAAAAASYNRMVEKMTGRTMPTSQTDAGTWLAERWPYVRIADYEWLTNALDALLTAERAEIHARYETVAKRCDREAESRSHYAKVDPDYRNTIIPYEAAADWIRAVGK